MKYLSLFSGIGGFEIGIQEAFSNNSGQYEQDRSSWSGRSLGGGSESDNQLIGVQAPSICVGYSEIDPYAIKVYERNFKHENYGDITQINEKELPDFDTLVGGFPCQSFSIAGKRGGFADTRGTLFFDIARILAEKKPKHLVLENVKGLLSHDKGRTLQTIIGVLSDLGYRVEWQVLNSKDFGVPQNRERIIIIGHLRGECGGQVFPILGVSSENLRKVVATGHQATDIYSPEGSAVTQSALGGGQGAKTGLYKIKEATSKGYAEAGVGDSINFTQPNSKTRRGRVGKGVANTLDTASNQATIEGSRVRRLTPTECERLQGFPVNWTQLDATGKAISDTQRYKMCGNAVTTSVVRAVFDRIIGVCNY